jgi:hypothetical protein
MLTLPVGNICSWGIGAGRRIKFKRQIGAPDRLGDNPQNMSHWGYTDGLALISFSKQTT